MLCVFHHHCRQASVRNLRSNKSCFLGQEATEVLPTEEEIDSAKAETLNSFIFNFASTNAQMQRTVIYALLGLPEVRAL